MALLGNCFVFLSNLQLYALYLWLIAVENIFVFVGTTLYSLCTASAYFRIMFFFLICLNKQAHVNATVICSRRYFNWLYSGSWNALSSCRVDISTVTKASRAMSIELLITYVITPNISSLVHILKLFIQNILNAGRTDT